MIAFVNGIVEDYSEEAVILDDTKLKFPVIPQQHFRPSASG